MADVSRQIVAVNGAEWLELEARARKAMMTMPQYLRWVCGLPARSIVNPAGVACQETSRGRHPTLALERRTITMPLASVERQKLLAEARNAEVGSLPQFIRSRAGLQIRNTSIPGTNERDKEEDDAWNRLQQIGLAPEGFFPPDR